MNNKNEKQCAVLHTALKILMNNNQTAKKALKSDVNSVGNNNRIITIKQTIQATENAENANRKLATSGATEPRKPKWLRGASEGTAATDILGACALAGAAVGAYFIHKRFNQRNEAEGTGRLATEREAKDVYGYEYARGGYLLGSYKDENQTFLNRLKQFNQEPSDLWLRPEYRFRMTKIQASTGSGKTTQFIVPQLIEDAYSNLFNVFIIDRKSPELARMTAGIWESLGQRSIIFDPWQPELCWGFEPLFGATEDEIEAIVEILVPMSHVEDATALYRNMDRDILRTLFRSAQYWGRKDRELATLPAVGKLLRKGIAATQRAINATGDRELVEGMEDVWKLPSGELSKMWRGLVARMSVFTESNVARAFSRSDFTMKDIVVPVARGNQVQKTILYVGAPQSKGDRSRKIASLMTRLLTIEAYRRGDEMRKQGLGWRDVVPVWECLDERGTYFIPEEDDSLATLRSLGVAVTVALQNDNQIIKWQGREAAATNETNFNYKIVLGGCDLEFAKKISEEIGKRWVWVKSETSSRSHDGFEFISKKTDGIGWRKVEEAVITPDAIINLPEDTALVIGKKCRPMKLKLYAFYKSQRMKEHVSTAEDLFVRRTKTNAELDHKGLNRLNGEVAKLPDPAFDWNNYLGDKWSAAYHEKAW